jgi:transposase
MHLIAVTQVRHDTSGRAYYQRKIAEGKTKKEALRALKRRISDAVWRQLQFDLTARSEAGPGGHPGTTLNPAWPARHPEDRLFGSVTPEPDHNATPETQPL